MRKHEGLSWVIVEDSHLALRINKIATDLLIFELQGISHINLKSNELKYHNH